MLFVVRIIKHINIHTATHTHISTQKHTHCAENYVEFLMANLAVTNGLSRVKAI
jgi:hypothetical protein